MNTIVDLPKEYVGGVGKQIPLYKERVSERYFVA